MFVRMFALLLAGLVAAATRQRVVETAAGQRLCRIGAGAVDRELGRRTEHDVAGAGLVSVRIGKGRADGPEILARVNKAILALRAEGAFTPILQRYNQ